MRRRDFLAGLAVSKAASLGAADSRPNILWVISDQFRADALGVAGNKFVHTPNLDDFSRGAVRFTNAYCPQALCTPARGAMLTGVYPSTNRLDGNVYGIDNVFALPDYRLQPNLPTLIRGAGYHTGYIGKWHLGEKDPGLFDYWNGYNSKLSHWTGERQSSQYRSEVETADALRFLGEKRTAPFMLTVSYYPPHTPYDPPRAFEDLYKDQDIAHKPYYGAVSAIDANVGRLLDGLKSQGLADNTLVIFTADHGETFGGRLGSTNKTVCYEESARVPLIMRWPRRLPSGLEMHGGVTTLDILPTVLEAAGLPLPARLQGKSRLREMERKQTVWKDPVFLQNITQKKVDGAFLTERAVRTEQWKLILRDRPNNELYDLKADPAEQHDLFPRPESKPVIRELARLIRGWGERIGDRTAVGFAEKYA
jgi:arylsulfatase A-like enzyme